MRKKIIYILCFIIIITGTVLFLNIEVTTRRGINYKRFSVKLPLYLKILDFFDRHYNYKILASAITAGAGTQEERVMRIFAWVSTNLKDVPGGFDIIDDHVWYIIVRGYGASDQFCDVFATLCNYAGCDAFFVWVKASDQTGTIPLSFVKIAKNWYVFDPYRAVYFKKNNDSLASISDIESGDWLPVQAKEKTGLDYSLYFYDLPDTGQEKFNRSSIQSPLKRLIYEIKKK